ncbi:DUF506 family protein (DUF506) [Rhynchospora pubera]|uniref:DUF506 family protein (DUF506) n=1 Tax=Rhynchospora pubera TaxID=906938 RepID=A0AAV8CAL3_9POAL|nr:DUF506 family protein (DUF506) [Rhynchospora pubera]KAJ4795046.1 DUF506 family protein (DUF506) [Rhynchospora pubera]
MKPLNADARARLSFPTEQHACSYSTSGSEHDSLSYLVHAFFENEYEVGKSTSPPTSGDDSDSDESTDRANQAAEEIRKLLKPRKKRDPFHQQLYSDVEEAAEVLAPLKANRSSFNRAIMTRLREKGYDSGLCKARWEGSKGLAPGNYEYIDVAQMLADGKKERFIVDVYFMAESEVAGPSDEYRTVLSALPEVMLVRQEEMKRVLRILADEAKRSLKSRCLSVPPWRKRPFLMAKWLGPYRRTTNPVSVSVQMAAGSDVKHRAVGFPVLQFPATIRMIGDEML